MVRVLPSKKIFFLIIACFVSVGVVGFAVQASKSANEEAKKQAANVQTTAIDIISNSAKEKSIADDDGDGLANWEEALWQTDPNKKDTDGDGTNDNDEIKAGRNPKIAGPNDKLPDIKPEDKAIATAIKTVEEDKTETGRLSRALFATYVEAKQAGVAIDPNIQGRIIDEAFSGKIQNPFSKQYSLADIKISGNQDLKKYGNDLGTAFNSVKSSGGISEIEILNNAVTVNKKEIERLDPIIKGYESLVNKVANTPVPNELLTEHLNLLNSLGSILSDIKSFRLIFDDPLVALGSLANYYPHVSSLQDAIRGIESAFEREGVDFKKGEAGYVFIHTI